MKKAFLILWVFVGLVGCGGGGGPGGGVVPNQAAPLVLAAGMVPLEPSFVDVVSPGTDIQRLGLDHVGIVYELTTPAGEPFAFDVFSRNDGNEGAVRVSVAHAADDGVTPFGALETLAEVGILPTGSGGTGSGIWFDAVGDGFARVTVSGSIERDQVIAVEAANSEGGTTALISVRVGPVSDINVPPSGGRGYGGVLEEKTIYSSDSWQFGMPTVAVSGDRTSVVAYEGDQANPYEYQRYEMRLQHDHGTGAVTGGAELEPSPDTGNWRDHEIAALFNVLALVRSGSDDVTLKLSFDRGATFAQTEMFGAGGTYSARLVQIGMAADYTLGVAFWRSDRGNATELVFVEGRPSAFDGGGSPTRFQFDAPRVLVRTTGDVMPVIMGITYGEGGDLVLGYGWSRIEWDPETRVSTNTTEFHCIVRLFGETDYTDTLVEKDITIARDPSVSVVGSGRDMRIFYAYEGAAGVRLRTSDDAGATWSNPVDILDRLSYMPSVFAREIGRDLRVDVLYLTWGEVGTELHLRHFESYGRVGPETYRLTEAEIIGGDGSGDRLPPRIAQSGALLPPEADFRLRQVSWFGYDATMDGDDIVVVYNEETTFPWDVIALPAVGGFEDTAGAALPAPDFREADPPPLAPGLTEPVRPPNPDHRNQLRVIRLD